MRRADASLPGAALIMSSAILAAGPAHPAMSLPAWRACVPPSRVRPSGAAPTPAPGVAPSCPLFFQPVAWRRSQCEAVRERACTPRMPPGHHAPCPCPCPPPQASTPWLPPLGAAHLSRQCFPATALGGPPCPMQHPRPRHPSRPSRRGRPRWQCSGSTGGLPPLPSRWIIRSSSAGIAHDIMRAPAPAPSPMPLGPLCTDSCRVPGARAGHCGPAAARCVAPPFTVHLRARHTCNKKMPCRLHSATCKGGRRGAARRGGRRRRGAPLAGGERHATPATHRWGPTGRQRHAWTASGLQVYRVRAVGRGTSRRDVAEHTPMDGNGHRAGAPGAVQKRARVARDQARRERPVHDARSNARPGRQRSVSPDASCTTAVLPFAPRSATPQPRPPPPARARRLCGPPHHLERDCLITRLRCDDDRLARSAGSRARRRHDRGPHHGSP